MADTSRRRWRRRGIGLLFNVFQAGCWSPDLTLELKGIGYMMGLIFPIYTLVLVFCYVSDEVILMIN
jgi:hypothetical protein